MNIIDGFINLQGSEEWWVRWEWYASVVMEKVNAEAPGKAAV